MIMLLAGPAHLPAASSSYDVDAMTYVAEDEVVPTLAAAQAAAQAEAAAAAAALEVNNEKEDRKVG